jgi:hypothetical protein
MAPGSTPEVHAPYSCHNTKGVHAFNPPRTAIARLCRLFVSSYTLLAVILGVRSEDV